MKRAIKSLTILLSAIFLLAACSSDDGEEPTPCFCDDNIIDTVRESGIMRFNKQVGRWYIQTHFHQLKNYNDEYYPKSIGKSFKKENLQVSFSGDIYDIHIEDLPSYESDVTHEIKRYCIDLTTITKM